MKKIFTLLLAAATFFSAAAQHNGNVKNSAADRGNDRNQYSSDYHSYGSDKTANYGTASFSFREKELELRRINLSYDQQIAAVNRKRYLSNREKKQQIRALEAQRMAAIRDTQFRYEQQLKRATATIPGKQYDRKW